MLRPNLNKKITTKEEKERKFEEMLKKALKQGKDKFNEFEKNKNKKIKDERYKLPQVIVEDNNDYKKKSE